MISISREMDEYDIAEEIRIERQVHKGSFLLVEGLRDIRRFDKFVDEDRCSTVNCFGRSNLIGAIQLLYEDGFLGALGLADADFDRLLSELYEHEGIKYSACHDFDLDWICDSLLDRYLKEVGDEGKCIAAGGATEISRKVHLALSPLSHLRFINVKHDLRYDLNDINHASIGGFEGVEVETLINFVSTGRFASPSSRQTLKDRLTTSMKHNYPFDQLTNGHDFFAVLGLALREQLGDRRPPQTWAREVEVHFRLGFSDEEFSNTNVFKEVVLWEAENTPYVIWRSRLRRYLN